MTIRKNLISAYIQARVTALEATRVARRYSRKLTEAEYRAAEIEANRIVLEAALKAKFGRVYT